MNNIIYALAGQPFKLSDPNSRTFRKEIIYSDAFFQPSEGKAFVVSEDQILNFKHQFDRMAANGIKVPVPIEHDSAPEANRGFVVAMSVARNADGKLALYADVQFVDPEFESLADKADVSIYSVGEFIDGKGNRYPGCIRHLAITSYPVIPHLSKFEAISASLIEGEDMNLAGIIKAAGMPDVEENKEEEEIIRMLKKSLSMEKELSELSAKLSTLEASLEASLADNGDDNEGDAKKMEEEKTLALSLISGTMVKAVKMNREHDLSALVSDGKISPAVAKKIAEKYNSDDGLKLSLLDDSSEFQDIIDILKENEVVPLGERSGHQSTNGASVNVLHAVIDARKES